MFFKVYHNTFIFRQRLNGAGVTPASEFQESEFKRWSGLWSCNVRKRSVKIRQFGQKFKL